MIEVCITWLYYPASSRLRLIPVIQSMTHPSPETKHIRLIKEIMESKKCSPAAPTGPDLTTSPSKTPHDQPCVTSTPRHPPHPLHPSLVCVCVTSELSSASSPPAAGVAGADFQKASSTRSPQKETAKETGPFLGAQIPTHILGVYTSTNIYVYSINMFLYQNISILR